MSHGMPTEYSTTSPRNIAPIELRSVRSHPHSDSHPRAAAARTNPNRYPPVADESFRNSTPESPPEKNGKPIAPCRRYSAIEITPRPVPSEAPTKSTPSVCPVIGTGVNGNLISSCARPATSQLPAKARKTRQATLGRTFAGETARASVDIWCSFGSAVGSRVRPGEAEQWTSGVRAFPPSLPSPIIRASTTRFYTPPDLGRSRRLGTSAVVFADMLDSWQFR